MKRKSEPVLRFEGFIDPWEQRKLGELGEITVKIILPSNSPDTLFYEYSMPAYDLDKNPVQVKGRDIALARVVISDPVLLINKLNVKKQRIWIVKHAGKNAVCTGEFLPFKSDKTDLEFIRQQLLSERVTEELSSLSAGSSNSQKRITPQVLLDFSIMVPSKQIESQKIAKFLGEFDSLITLHQRKLEALKKTKVSMLEKIFPKEGEQYPEIRFEGFTDPWEQCKLGELAEIVGGGTPSTDIEEYWDGEIDWYVPAELGEQRYVDSSLRKITQAGYDNSSAKMLPANKTILFTSRAGIGNTAILRRSACTNQGFQSLVINDSADVDFVYSLSDKIKHKAEIMASGSTFLEISGKQLAEMGIQVPHLDEQRRIGTFFRKLDNLITLHQRKLDGLKMTKKAFQSKMLI